MRMKNKQALLIIFILLLFAVIAGCKQQKTLPEPAFQNPCRPINALTCRTPSATTGIVCCMNIFNRNPATGYLCVLGRDRFMGCYNSLEQARQLGCRGTVVRCVRE